MSVSYKGPNKLGAAGDYFSLRPTQDNKRKTHHLMPIGGECKSDFRGLRLIWKEAKWKLAVERAVISSFPNPNSLHPEPVNTASDNHGRPVRYPQGHHPEGLDL